MCGRNDNLLLLQVVDSLDAHATQVVTIAGMFGIGKSQLAADVARRAIAATGLPVFWLSVTSRVVEENTLASAPNAVLDSTAFDKARVGLLQQLADQMCPLSIPVVRPWSLIFPVKPQVNMCPSSATAEACNGLRSLRRGRMTWWGGA